MNIKRFWSYTLTQLKMNNRGYLRSLLLYAGICIVIYLFSFITEIDKEFFAGFLSVVAFCMWMAKIATSFKDYHRSNSAPRVMMLPVSKTEKYFCAALLNIVLYPIALTVIYIAATYVTQLISGVTLLDKLSDYTIVTISGLNTDVPNNSRLTFSPFSYGMQVFSFVWYAMYFFMSSALFRRRALGKGIAMLIGLGILVSTFAILWVKEYMVDGSFIMQKEAEFVDNLVLVGFLINVLLFILVCWVSYRRFMNLQIKR